MVVNLSISQWSVRKYDSKVSREVNNNHSAAQDAGRFNKLLIAADAMKEITRITGAVRSFHYVNTLPWTDDGSRILPAGNYFNYINEVNNHKQKFEEVVQEFINQYPDLKEDAEYRLGTMFNVNDYPDTKEIEAKFRIKTTFMPIADENDFRVSMSNDEVAQIKSDITAELNNRVQNALNDILERSREVVLHMAETLAEPNKVFRDSLLGNVKALVETIPLLNFTNDAHVNDVCNLLASLDYDPETLRWKLSLRKEVAAKAKLIYNQI